MSQQTLNNERFKNIFVVYVVGLISRRQRVTKIDLNEREREREREKQRKQTKNINFFLLLPSQKNNSES